MSESRMSSCKMSSYAKLLAEDRPVWAIGKAKSFTDIGARLCTRDGRVCGNSVVVEYPCICRGFVCAKVVSDFGSIELLNECELEERFYHPEWLMNTDKTPGFASRGLIVSVDLTVPGERRDSWVLASLCAKGNIKIHASGSGKTPALVKDFNDEN